MTKKVVRAAFVKTLPVFAGYIVLGIGFGILLRKSGYGVIWALAMSIFIYAGSMQYVGVSLIAGGASLITTALTALTVNARHLFYSISMINVYKDAGKKKPYLIFALTDETYSLLCDGKAPEGCDENAYRLSVSLFDQCYWTLGSVLGSVLGAVIPFDTTGIEFSMTALFVTVFVQQWQGAKNHLPALLGLTATAVCRLAFGSELFLIPSMVLITTALLLMRNKSEEGNENER